MRCAYVIGTDLDNGAAFYNEDSIGWFTRSIQIGLTREFEACCFCED
jgi:hypothetical protein